MSRRKTGPSGNAETKAAAESLDAVRRVLTDALNALVTETRANHDPRFTSQAVAALVDSWSRSALAMIDAAFRASQPNREAAADHPAPLGTQALQPDVRASILEYLAIIVTAATAGQQGVEAACIRLADVLQRRMNDEAAAAYLRALVLVEDALGVARGAPN
jgi:hypothetical protein